MGKRRRTLLIAAMSIMLSVAMLVAGTYALFSDSVTVENHLVAGTLQVTLVRTKLEQRKLDADGVVKDLAADDNPEDFTHATTKNIFGMEEGELIAPSSSYKATMRVTNGGTVAFDYIVRIKLGTSGDKQSDEDLCRQVKVVVNGDTENARYLYECADNDLEVLRGRIVAGGSQAIFTIQLIFENRSDNNNAQAQKAWFDLTVEALQAVA